VLELWALAGAGRPRGSHSTLRRRDPTRADRPTASVPEGLGSYAYRSASATCEDAARVRPISGLSCANREATTVARVAYPALP
jgi:hypothetical protein